MFVSLFWVNFTLFPLQLFTAFVKSQRWALKVLDEYLDQAWVGVTQRLWKSGFLCEILFPVDYLANFSPLQSGCHTKLFQVTIITLSLPASLMKRSLIDRRINPFLLADRRMSQTVLSFRPTLYVGKLDSHLYASTSLVHHGVSLVVSIWTTPGINLEGARDE